MQTEEKLTVEKYFSFSVFSVVRIDFPRFPNEDSLCRKMDIKSIIFQFADESFNRQVL